MIVTGRRRDVSLEMVFTVALYVHRRQAALDGAGLAVTLCPLPSHTLDFGCSFLPHTIVTSRVLEDSFGPKATL